MTQEKDPSPALGFVKLDFLIGMKWGSQRLETGLGPPLPRLPHPLRFLQGWDFSTYGAAGNRTPKTNYLNGVTSNFGCDCSNSRVIFPPQYC
jgi:hypothetical protein